MDTKTTDGPDERRWADVAACTLPTAERPLRVAEFDDLFATSLRSIDRTGETGVRMLLAGDSELAGRTQRLADAEAACCSFFTFTVMPLEDGLVAFDVEVPAAYVDVLRGLVARADGALGGAS